MTTEPAPPPVPSEDELLVALAAGIALGSEAGPSDEAALVAMREMSDEEKGPLLSGLRAVCKLLGATPGAPLPVDRGSFRSELTSLINSCSRENGSNTPDFVLAEFLVGALAAFDRAVLLREQWYGRDSEFKRRRVQPRDDEPETVR